MSELHQMTAHRLRKALRDRQISARELTRFYLDRISKYDRANHLNTIAELNPSALLQASALDASADKRDLPLFGLPILIKDNIDVAGLHTTAGSLALADNLALADAPVAANLKRNGAVILGKTNMTEFANYTTEGMPNGYSSRGGQVRNAYLSSKDPGGSSTGSGVAVSAGFCAAAIGTDTSFSIVGCARDNAITGLKPAHGSLCAKGIIPISHTLDTAGPMTKDFADALTVYSSMRDKPFPAVTPTAPGRLRIAVNICNQEQLPAAENSLLQEVLSNLCSAGAAVFEVSQPASPYEEIIMRCEFRHDLEAYLSASSAGRKTLQSIIQFYEENPSQMMKYGITCLTDALSLAAGRLDDAPYLEAMRTREVLRPQIVQDLRDCDACIMTGSTNIMHFLGLPSVTLRLGTDPNRIPHGMILYGTDETRLFAAALTIERFCLPVAEPVL